MTGFTRLGIRNVSSTAPKGYDDARAMGSDILSVRQFRKLGVDAMLARIPEGRRYCLTIDIDGFDPSIAPGTGTPSHGGFVYYEMLELIAALAKRGSISSASSSSLSSPPTPAASAAIFSPPNRRWCCAWRSTPSPPCSTAE